MSCFRLFASAAHQESEFDFSRNWQLCINHSILIGRVKSMLGIKDAALEFLRTNWLAEIKEFLSVVHYNVFQYSIMVYHKDLCQDTLIFTLYPLLFSDCISQLNISFHLHADNTPSSTRPFPMLRNIWLMLNCTYIKACSIPFLLQFKSNWGIMRARK